MTAGAGCLLVASAPLVSPVVYPLAFVSTPRVSKPTSSLDGGRGEKGVCDAFVCSRLSLEPGVPGISLWETLARPPGSSPALAQRDPSPHELCSRQTVPDFQETRPRNYILSASASAVSVPTPPFPWPPPPPLPHRGACYTANRSQITQEAPSACLSPCPVTMWLALLLPAKC